MANLSEESPVLETIESSFDVTKRHWRYVAVGTYEGNPNAQAEVSDYENFLPAVRGRKIEQISKESASINDAANFIRSRAILDSFEISITVDGWHYKGKIWEPGKILTLKAPWCYIEKETQFMIREANFSIDESAGQKTSLSLCLPSSFTGESPKSQELPWDF